jgi:AraC-like DNA-binding protein
MYDRAVQGEWRARVGRFGSCPLQFKRATGLPPYQYVVMRRVERAEQLLQAGTDLSLAEIAARAGFPDQSVFCRHFKRLVGVTPGRFRMHTRIA